MTPRPGCSVGGQASTERPSFRGADEVAVQAAGLDYTGPLNSRPALSTLVQATPTQGCFLFPKDSLVRVQAIGLLHFVALVLLLLFREVGFMGKIMLHPCLVML